jgi:site-specific DNA-methyltransferase (adenine-specific)
MWAAEHGQHGAFACFEHDGRTRVPATNHHPTVKPVALMRWLVRLVTPPGGTVLDPFAGSGSTGVACVLEGCAAILCEQDPDYLAIAQARIAHARQAQPGAIQAALLTEGVA